MRHNYFRFRIATEQAVFENVEKALNFSDASPATQRMITSGFVAAISTSGIRQCRTTTKLVC